MDFDYLCPIMKEKRWLIFVLLASWVIMTVIVGSCDKQKYYDRRLTVADSIMTHDPDSALTLLENLDNASLATARDRAYHALLLTQARYRCYITATSDSLINVALDYYRTHDDETEKLTRSYIYKGAVMEELGDAEAAMRYYKQAQSSASANDLFNQGYSRLRMGCLYRDNTSADTIYIPLVKEALAYFKQIPDSFYILNCQNNLGGSYTPINADSALHYLEQADTMASQLHLEYFRLSNLRYIADLKMFSNKTRDLEQAKDISTAVINTYKDLDERDHFTLIASYTLAKLNKTDSSTYYLNQVDYHQISDGLKILYNQCRAEIAKNHGNFNQFKHYYDLANDQADSIANNDVQRQLREVEAKYDNEAMKYESLKYKANWQRSLLCSLLLLSVLAIAMLVILRKASQRKRLLREHEDTIERLHSDTVRLTAQLAANKEMSEDLKQTIRHQIDTFTQLVEMHQNPSRNSQRKFDEHFEKTYSVKQPDLSFWSGIRAYADSTCGGIITQTLEACPSLSESDVRFLSLCCCDLPTTVIMACMGYNDAHSFYNKKRRIAQAIGLPMKLDSYIQSFKGNN